MLRVRNLISMVLLLVSVLIIPVTIGAQGYSQSAEYHRAQIISIERTGTTHADEKAVISLKILDGEKTDHIVKVTMGGKESSPAYVRYSEGQKIFISLNRIQAKDHIEEYVSMHDVDNTPVIAVSAILFFAALFGVARFRGLISVFGLVFTVLLLFFVFVPLTLKGFPPLVSSVAVSLLSIAATIPMITGLTRKSLAAGGGAAAGIITSVGVVAIIGAVVNVSGIVNDELITLFYVSGANIDIRDVALSGMIIASLGAVIDVSVSVSSAVAEFFAVHPDVDRREAFRSAMKVGRDNLGSMVNTLVMAYVGSSLSLVLIIAVKSDTGVPFSMIINHNEVLVEILKSFAGCIGMTAAVPVTAFLCVRLHGGKRHE